MLIDGEKFACEACVRGHRVSNCQHSDRPLQHINKKGRPVSQCQHCRSMRKSRAAHVKCDCGEKTSKCAHLQPALEGHRETCCCNHGGRCTCSHKKESGLDTVPEGDPAKSPDQEVPAPRPRPPALRRWWGPDWGGIRDVDVQDEVGLQTVRWHKLCINAAFNPSAVLSGGRGNADMVSDPALREHALGVMREIWDAVPRVLGRSFPAGAATPERIVTSTERNAGARPSMLLDWEARRPLELEVILGNPVRIARARGVEMPRLQSLERAKEALREEEAKKADEDGDGKGDDDSDGDEDVDKKGVAGASKTAKKATGKKADGDAGKGKKRKAEGDADKGPKTKKKKEDPKPKVPKPKGPVDVERQCGVLLPNGMPCARSLTCKSHSMGAKRAVAGRSLPYDMLLAAYQKKNQAKQQKAALDAIAPIEDKDDANTGPVDSDEETAAVMSALSHWNPQPVVPQPVVNPIKRNYQLARLHEQLQMATNGGRTSIFKVVGFGAQKLPEGHLSNLADGEDAPGEPDSAIVFGVPGRSSSFGMQGQEQRRPSVSSRG
ncbi:hypothetical protein BN1708_010879 [Verticillium longisporum]|uniref:SCA7 domain-containing protein n=1 Tax=Verticillium longisporum TaxID=100787 RepID=A0A0G4KV69_VERLO|nr:hypothetical protein BN1708_010879 [Verticillium longisporum]